MKKNVFLVVVLFLVCLFPIFAASGGHSDGTPGKMVTLVFQIAIIIISSKLVGIFFSKFLKQPASLGEIITGIIIGPYALGGIPLPFLGTPFFPLPVDGGTIPVSVELYGFAILASIILLFLSGLETDLPTFIKFSGKGTLVGLGGAFFSFLFGDLCAVIFLPLLASPETMAELGTITFMHPTALFLGTLSTATSVGITARILSDKRKMSSPEGVTILAGAVLDDVIGIVLLAIVLGISTSSAGGEAVSAGKISMIALKAFGFWIICTLLGILLAPKLSKILKKMKSIQSITIISLGMALLLAGLSEKAGLAMIIGAYIMGLSLSQTDIAHQIRESLEGVYDFLVPIFFCVMGMMVDFRAMQGIVIFGLIYTFFAIIAKVFGSGIPAMLSGFNFRGGMRIGLGMLPRGEVALIIAGIGLASGAISQEFFGVSVMMLLITTLMAPPLLVQSFKGGSGYKKKFQKVGDGDMLTIDLDFGNSGMATLFRRSLLQSFRNEEYYVQKLDTDEPTYSIRKDNLSMSVIQNEENLKIVAPPQEEPYVRLMVVEEVLELKELLQGLEAMKKPELMGAEVMMKMFSLNNSQK